LTAIVFKNIVITSKPMLNFTSRTVCRFKSLCIWFWRYL